MKATSLLECLLQSLLLTYRAGAAALYHRIKYRTLPPAPRKHTHTQSLDVTRRDYIDKDKSTFFFNISATISEALLS